MLLHEIIREAGLSPKDYPHASQLPIILYDRKNRVVEDSSIHFQPHLFASNDTSKLAFQALMEELENNIPAASFSMKINENSVIVYLSGTKHFSRLPPPNLKEFELNYMS